jgi:hypothetical protein
MRRELTVKADEVRQELSTRADEIVARAKDQEWVPMFQRDDPTNGQPDDVVSDATASVEEAAADAGTAAEDVSNATAEETAEPISETFDPVDRESRS